jgi:hypothetical protein
MQDSDEKFKQDKLRGRKSRKILKVKVKVKFTPEQATKVQMGNRGIALLFL